MKLSFRYKFILSFVTLEIVFLSLIAFFNFGFIDQSSQKLIDDKLNSIKVLSQKLLLVPVSTYDTATLDDILSSLLQIDNITAAKVTTASGQTLSQKGDINIDVNECTNDIHFPLKSDDITVGYLHIWLDFSENIERITKNKNQTLKIIILEVSISILLSLLIGRNIALNLESLTQATDSLSENQRYAIPSIKGNDEVAALAKAMQNMQKNILEQNEKIVEANTKLEKLNATLEQRVKEEVAKNREKDQQMIQQSKLAQMGEMIGMIAHQWRQPLASISMMINNMLLDIELQSFEEQKAVSILKNMNEQLQHLSKTIDDFRNFFKNNKEKVETSLNKVVESTLDIVGNSIVNKNIILTTDLQSTQIFETYAGELQQVILNLIQNSEDAIIQNSIENGKIEIFTKDDEEGFYFTIKDNGGGIPKEVLNKIFEPYFSTKTSKNGTGLGLYMSKTIIEEHCKGKLEVSTKDNTTTFTITLFDKKV